MIVKFVIHVGILGSLLSIKFKKVSITDLYLRTSFVQLETSTKFPADMKRSAVGKHDMIGEGKRIIVE